MNFWKKVRALLPSDDLRAESAGLGEGDDRAPAESQNVLAADPLDGEIAKLVALGEREQHAGSEDTEIAIEAFERLCAGGRETLAIELARQVLAKMSLPRFRTQVACRLDARGEDRAALALLGDLVTSAEAPLDAWMLAAEIEERAGHVERALALYERILARDVDYPRARERAQRLSEGRRVARSDLGATLMVPRSSARGRYEVVRELGRGGAGVIFLAKDLELGRSVALKVYGRRGRADRERLFQEARTAASLEHPGVIRILDVDTELCAIAMELIEHGSIRSWLSRGTIPREHLVPWIKSTIDAVRYVHARGVVHCDLKPSNMLLREVDCVVLTDFGIAKKAGDARGGLAEGTMAYMSPEQRSGAIANPQMDVYALGVTIRELCVHSSAAPPPSLLEMADACSRVDPGERPRLDELAVIVSELSQ